MDFGPFLLLATMEGLVMAAVLALTASGLSLVFGVMRVVNVAHGEFFMLGAVLAWFVAEAMPGPPWLGFMAALAVAPLLVASDRGLGRHAHPPTSELRARGHHRRHHRPALHPPAGRPHLLRPRRAPGRRALRLAHPAAVVRLVRLQALRHRRRLRDPDRSLAPALAHPHRPRDARHAIRQRDRARLRHRRRPGLCRRLRARRGAGGGRRRS